MNSFKQKFFHHFTLGAFLGVFICTSLNALNPGNDIDVSVQPDYYSGEPAIAADANYVYTVWEDYRAGDFDIYFKRSLNGTNWTDEKRIFTSTLMSLRPEITVAGSQIIVVWEEKDEVAKTSKVLMTSSTDGGNLWTTPFQVNTAGTYAGFPSLTSTSVFAYVTWEDGRNTGNDEIYYRRYYEDDGGWFWDTADHRVSNAAGDSWGPDIAVDGLGNLHITWFDYRSGIDQIHYAKSTNFGVSWIESGALTTSTEVSWDPGIAIDAQNNVHIVYYDWTTQNDEIYYLKSNNNGTSFLAPVMISDGNSADSRYPDIITTANSVIVVWEDYRDGNDEIYCNMSSNYGADWSTAPNQRCTNDNADSWAAVITNNAKGIYVSWYDTRNGADDIFDFTSNTITGIQDKINIISFTTPADIFSTPNPFKHFTTIKYSFEKDPGVSIYTMNGQFVTYLFDNSTAPSEVVWDGTNLNGEKVTPGKYIYKTHDLVNNSGYITLIQ